jgi:hypothetical protein
MKTNIKLLSAIRERGFRQIDFAKVVGDHHTFISRVVNGWVNLDDVRKAKYARVLGKETTELFED